MSEQIWAIAIKASESEPALMAAASATAQMQAKFDIPTSELRVGTMDSLMSLGDDLNKMDMFAEGTAGKLFKQLDDLTKEAAKDSGMVVEDTPAMINGVGILSHVKTWSWDEAKFQLKTPLRELAETISQRITGLDDELKAKTMELNALKATITQYERKTQGNLMVRGLDDIVNEDDILESEYMTTILLCVPRSGYKEFLAGYMKMADFVVPLTAKKITEDAEFGLFAVVVFKKSAEQFKAAAREKRYTVREFLFDEAKIEAGEKEKSEKMEEYKRLKGLLTTWCRINFAEAYSMTLHIKAIRVFVESCMRFGLVTGRDGARRPNFKSYLLLPKKGRSEALRKDLAKLYSTAGAFLDGDDDMVPGATGTFYPYVDVPITYDFLYV